MGQGRPRKRMGLPLRSARMLSNMMEWGSAFCSPLESKAVGVGCLLVVYFVGVGSSVRQWESRLSTVECLQEARTKDARECGQSAGLSC